MEKLHGHLSVLAPGIPLHVLANTRSANRSRPFPIQRTNFIPPFGGFISPKSGFISIRRRWGTAWWTMGQHPKWV